MSEQKYTQELNDVLSYMYNDLIKLYPASEITHEYLITSFLENKKCYVNFLLENFLMSSNLEQLRKIYKTYLSEKPISVSSLTNTPLSKEMEEILENAQKESENLNNNIIGSQHVLLAMLNPTNKQFSKIQEVFKNIGIDYDIIINKCNKNVSNDNSDKEIKQKNKKSILSLNSKTNRTAQVIQQYTVNLNELAKKGTFDKLIGREHEMNLIIQTLGRRKKNNVVLVGNSGVGKTHIIKGLASLINDKNVPDFLINKEILMLDIISLVSGTHFRGMFEERINNLFNELKKNKNYILFIDDIQNVLKNGNGGKDKDTDITSIISNILSENEIRVIGTTTFKDYRNSVECNSSISRQMQKITIEPVTKEECFNILKQTKTYYETYHKVSFSDEILKNIIDLSEKYITDKKLPDSAIDILDLSGSYAKLQNELNSESELNKIRKQLKQIIDKKENYLNEGNFETVNECLKEENSLKLKLVHEKDEKSLKPITLDILYHTISNMTNIPINKLSIDDKNRLKSIETLLKKEIIGQDEAVDKICRIIKRNQLGISNKNKTLGNVLMIGSSGCGKTLLAKKIAELIYGNENNLIRLDMSEFSEKNSVAKLIGASPGYIGYDNGGQLTEAIKNKPYCVLLLDEIEKADSEVYNLFLQLFDEGRLTDSSGQIINCKNVIVLMTSNIGTKEANDFNKPLGFINNSNNASKNIIEKQLKQKFAPEFINRIDQIIYFNKLTDENLKNIIKLELNKLNKRLKDIDYQITYDDNVVNYIYDLIDKNNNYGARPIIRIIQEKIEDSITNILLEENNKQNNLIKITYENGKLLFN